MLEACVLKRIDQRKIPLRAMAMIMPSAVSSQYDGKRFGDNELFGSLSHT